MSAVSTTKHAKRRMKQRSGLQIKSADRVAQIAYEKGIKQSEATGNLRRWMDRLYFYNQQANQMRLYGDKAYIFHDDTLITILQIPHNLLKEVARCRK